MLFNKKISLVIPAHNEEGGLAHLLPDVPTYIDEVVVVDNNSTDGTGEVARGFWMPGGGRETTGIRDSS